MSLEDLLNGQQWAIKPEVLDGFMQLLDLRSLGGDLDALAARLPGAGQQKRAPKAQGSTAIVPIDGALSKRSFLFDCGSTYAGIRDAIQAALDDPSVSAILLDVDSPGGSVAGMSELTDFISQADKVKPVYAFTDGLMCSAAYCLSCAARQVVAAPTATVGSIGILGTHTDRSQRDQSAGIKRTVLTAGSHKAIGTDTAPLDDKSRAVMQAQLDQLYSIFVNTVAANRGLTADDAESWADGKVFLAADAKAQGLIDEVGTRDNLLARISNQEATMDLKQLKAEHPDLVKAIQAEAVTDIKPQAEKAQTDAVAAEQGRIIGLAKAVLGDETGAKLEGLAKSGMSVEQAVAAKGFFGGVAGAEKQQGSAAQAEAIETLKKANATPVQAGAAAKPQDFMSLVEDHMKTASVSKAKAIAHIARTNPESHAAFVAQQKPKA